MEKHKSITNRRKMLQLTSAAGVAVLAGCVDQIPGFGGNEYEPGDDEEAMITLDYFGEGWIEDDEIEDDDIGEDDGPEFETGTDRYFYTEEEDEAVFVALGIAEDADTAEEIIGDWTTSNIVSGESVDLGDGGERGEVEGFAAVAFTHSNAGIFSMATRQAGFELEPMHGRAYDVGEDILDNLQEL